MTSVLLFVEQWIVSVSNMYSFPGPGEQHYHFCEGRAKEDPEGSELRLPRILREKEKQQQRSICGDHA